MALSYVGAHTDAGTTTNLPTYNVGDLALVFAYRDGSNTAPSLASGYTNITSGGANSNSARVGYRVLGSGETTIGTWTNATEVQVIVLRGQHTAPIGASSVGGASSNAISYTGFTLTDTDGSSWVVGFAGHRSATDVNVKTVTGMTLRSGLTTTLGNHTAQDVSTFATSSYSSTVNASSGWRSHAIEVIAANPKTTGTARLSLGTLQVPATRTEHSITVRARLTSALSGFIRAELYEGTTARSSPLDTSLLGTTFQTFVLSVADADAASIGSYSNLELRLTGISNAGDAAVFEIAQASLQVPPPASGAAFGSVVLPLSLTSTTIGTVSGAGTKQTGIATLSLGSVFTPATRTLHSITVRARKTNGAHTGTIRAQLYEGSTSRSAILETSALTTSLADYTLSIADADAATIGSYANLEIRLWGYSSTGTATVFEVANASLTVPTALAGAVTGQVVFSATSAISIGAAASVPIYPGAAVYPRPMLDFASTSTVAIAGSHIAYGKSATPLVLAINTAGTTPLGAREGAVAFSATTTVAVAGKLDSVGALLLASTGTITIGGASQDITGQVAFASTTTVSIAGNVPVAPVPAGFINLAFPAMPDILIAVAFPNEPLDPFPTYYSIAEYVRGINTRRGRQFELGRIETGQESFVLSNNNGTFSPENPSSPYYGNLKANRRVRFALSWNGTPYEVFNGYLEGFPQEFPSYGFDSIVNQNAVDAFFPLKFGKLIPASTTLTQPITTLPTQTSASETIQVATTGLPMPQAVPFDVKIDSETMTVTEIASASSWVVTRQQTNAATHLVGAAVTTDNVSFGQEYTGTRIKNVLERIGLTPAQYSLEAGQTLLLPSDNLSGTDPLEHINFVTEVEGGRFFAARHGVLTFHDRHHQFKVENTARATFGDIPPELPYADIQLDHDDEKIYNIVRIKTPDENVAEVRDEQSIDDYFERVLEKTWPLADANEALSAATYLLKRYSQMQVRVSEITLLGQALPDTLWPIILGADLGYRFQVIRRPRNDATISHELIVEGIQHQMALDKMTTKFQMSLADTTHYWRLGVAGYSELGSTTRLTY